MDSPRIGDWMVTATGRQYWPLDPRPEDVCITDIATSLSKMCRFGGHCGGHYSVAEHSVLVSYVVPIKDALHGLMHDATEAYCMDIPRPLKVALGAVYANLEHSAWLAIAERFDLAVQLPPSVKAADNAVLMAERDALFPSDYPKWSVNVEPAPVRVMGLDWPLARQAFLQRFNELMSMRAAGVQ